MSRSEREKAIFESVEGFKKEMNNEKIWLEVKEAARNASLDRMVSMIIALVPMHLCVGGILVQERVREHREHREHWSKFNHCLLTSCP
jgi:hypothetical protein